MCTYRHTKAYYEHLHSQIITYALTDTHGHVCEHRLTSRHTDKDEEFWLPDCKNAAGPQGWLTSALHLHSFEELKPRQPSWTGFIPLLCTHFQMVKSTGWNLLSAIKRCQFSKLCLNPALLEGSLRRRFSLHCPSPVSRAVLSFCLPHHLVLKS
jgi:hypothetical protein